MSANLYFLGILNERDGNSLKRSRIYSLFDFFKTSKTFPDFLIDECQSLFSWYSK